MIMLWTLFSAAMAKDLEVDQKTKQTTADLSQLVKCIDSKPNTSLDGCSPTVDPWGQPYQLIPSTN